MVYTEKEVRDILNALMAHCEDIMTLKGTPVEDCEAVDDAEHMLNLLNAGFESNVRQVLNKANEPKKEAGPDYETVLLVLRAFKKYVHLCWKGMDDTDPESTENPEAFEKELADVTTVLDYMGDLQELAKTVMPFIDAVKK